MNIRLLFTTKFRKLWNCSMNCPNSQTWYQFCRTRQWTTMCISWVSFVLKVWESI